MSQTTMLNLLLRRTPGPIQWEDVIVGHDFTLLNDEDVLAWVDAHGVEGENTQRLKDLCEEDKPYFLKLLRGACQEATGRIPRPGSHAWTQGQDRWRIALLRDVLEAASSPEALATLVESVYDMVGGPEDMLSLWHAPTRWDTRPHFADPNRVEAFVQRLEGLRRGSVAA
jgi:hypothetical protein